MVFSSIVFLFYFLIPVLIIYYILPKESAKNVFLFAASLIFYAWGEPKYVFLMLFSVVFNYLSGLAVHKKRSKLLMALNVIVNIGILGVFKYTNFMLDIASSVFGAEIRHFEILLPVGISFYTFQALSYVIDVYRGEADVQRNPVLFGLYLSLFPQLIAGPIVKYKDIEKQLVGRTYSYQGFVNGFLRFSAGLCKKVLIANNVGALWDTVCGIPFSELHAADAWLGIIAFALQIYFDFSGYSDMAIGMGKMLGFDFCENFNYPYISKSVTEFWRRWHISLGTWFREYIYIPLGGSRKGKFRTYVNIFAVWALTGLWHGAAMNFVVWGLYFGVVLVIEKTLRGFLEGRAFFEKVPKWLGALYTLPIVLISWVFFSADNLSAAVSYISVMFGAAGGGVMSPGFLYRLASYAPLIAVSAVIATGLPKKLYGRISRGKIAAAASVCAVLGIAVCCAYLIGDSYNPFLYFRF